MESPAGWKIFAVYGVVGAAIALTIWFPRSWWSRTLHSTHGPRTDLGSMTRGEAWRSALSFVMIGAISFGLSIGSFVLSERVPVNGGWHSSLSALFFIAALGALLGGGGALYLLVGSAFRPTSLYRWHEDPLSKAEFLKAYESADGLRRALIFRHGTAEFEIVAVEAAPPGARDGIDPRVLGDRVLRSLGTSATLEAAEAAARAVTGHAAEGP